MNIGAVIFDMDGVLADTEPLHCKVDRDFLKKEDITVSDEDFKASCGKTEWEFFEDLATKHGHAKEKSDTWMTQKIKLFATALEDEGIQPIPGVVEVARYAAAHFPCAVASSGRKVVIKTVVEKIGLSDELKVQVSAEDVPMGKPHPDVYLLAAKTLGVDPTKCIAIEDSTNGIRAAKTAGMYCIGFKNPHSGDQDLSEADFVVEKMTDVLDILEK
jgi:HAD superfamily hydrolase (TIGR01509 family)